MIKTIISWPFWLWLGVLEVAMSLLFVLATPANIVLEWLEE